MTRPVARLILLLLVVGAACGKKGPPLAPLRIAPGPVTDLSARRIGNQVVLHFQLPEGNTGEQRGGRVDLTRVEVYALSVARPADAPAGDEFIRNARKIASVPIQPEARGQRPEAGGQPAARQGAQETEDRARTVYEVLDENASKFYTPKNPPPATPVPPAATGTQPGEPVEEPEEEEEEALKRPVPPIPPPQAQPAPTGTPPKPGPPPTATHVAAPPVPVRVYMVVAVGRRDQRGPGATARVPLTQSPASPATPAATYSARAVALTWEPVPAASSYNVYEVTQAQTEPPVTPLNAAPLTAPAYEDTRVDFGRARCYAATAVHEEGPLRVESAMSPPSCVTPEDTFPPPAPGGLAAVAGPGAISLIWDPVETPDLAGYLVLRGDAPGDTLQALTPEPISETTYRDAAVKPGTTYVYAVVAVDKVKNASAQSTRVQETAR